MFLTIFLHLFLSPVSYTNFLNIISGDDPFNFRFMFTDPRPFSINLIRVKLGLPIFLLTSIKGSLNDRLTGVLLSRRAPFHSSNFRVKFFSLSSFTYFYLQLVTPTFSI